MRLLSLNLLRKARGALERYLVQENKVFQNAEKVTYRVTKIMRDFKVDEPVNRDFNKSGNRDFKRRQNDSKHFESKK